MITRTATVTGRKKFIDIPTAAESAGFSSRQFRKIIEEDAIPVTQIGSKMFVDAEDFDTWKVTRGERRLQDALQYVEGWLREGEARARRLQQEQEEANLNFRMALSGGL